jgi:hypothetical protein
LAIRQGGKGANLLILLARVAGVAGLRVAAAID